MIRYQHFDINHSFFIADASETKFESNLSTYRFEPNLVHHQRILMKMSGNLYQGTKQA